MAGFIKKEWNESTPEIGKWVLIQGFIFDHIGKVVDENFWECTKGANWPIVNQHGAPFRWKELPYSTEVESLKAEVSSLKAQLQKE
jgi:hypothetical protein